MTVCASISNKQNIHVAEVSTDGRGTSLMIAPKANGYGSSVNGGELLMLALATCCCNDLYREAGKKNILIHEVNVEVTGEFLKEGEAGANLKCHVRVKGDASEKEIRELIEYTDKVAEIHNTLRKGAAVTLELE